MTLLDALAQTLRAHSADTATAGAIRRTVWIAGLIEDALTYWLGEGGLSAESAALAIVALLEATDNNEFLREHHRSVSQSAHGAVRRQLFWHQVARCTAKNRRFPRKFWEIRLPHIFDLIADDIPWLKEDCLSRADVRERLLAFQFLITLLPRDAATSEPRKTLQTIADADPALAKRLARLSNPPGTPEPCRWDLQRRAHADRAKRVARSNQAALTARLEAIRTGQDFWALKYLHERSEYVHKNGSYGGFDEATVAAAYNADVAQAARDGLRCFWRQNAPTLMHEYSEPNSTPWVCILGLTGLALDVYAGCRVSTLPLPEIRRALGYGMWELNGFPDWVDEVARAQPALVADVFAPTLRLDYERVYKDKDDTGGQILRKLSRAHAGIRAACAPEILALLLSSDPPCVSTLSDCLAVVEAEDCFAPEALLDLARKRTSAAGADAPRLAVWWCVWASFSPEDAVLWLEEHLEGVPSKGALIERVSARLWTLEEHKPPRRLALRSSVAALSRFIPIVYASSREEHGEVGSDGYSSLSDDARRLRDTTWTWLGAIEGEDTVHAFEHLADDPRLADRRDWIRHLSETRAAANKHCAPMTVEDAVSFASELVREPVTTAELFEIAMSRLGDIVAHLAADDFSIRQAFNPKKAPILEAPVQQFLAKELEDKSRGQYAVVREPEVDQWKKPDIRLVNNRCRGPVTLEAKIAQRWKLKRLEDAIETQLVGQYLRTNKSTYGILVVASSGPKRTACIGSKMTFSQLVSHLAKHASRIKARNPHLHELVVVGIDFHDTPIASTRRRAPRKRR